MNKHQQEKQNINLVVLLGAVSILLFAWYLFIHDLNSMSMWLDESFSWRISSGGPQVLLSETAADVHPPLYYFWLWTWLKLTGTDNLTVMHISSAITALLTVAVCYQLGKAWFRSPWAASAAAVFIASSGMFIFYARDLRMHSASVLFVSLSWWMFSRVVEKRSPWWVYALSLALAAYNFYFSGFMIVFQLLIALIFYRDRLREIMWAWLGAGLLFLPWLPTFFKQVDITTRQRGDGSTLGVNVAHQTTRASIVRFLDIYAAEQTALVGVLLVVGILAGFSAVHSKRYRRWLVAVIAWGLVAIVFMFSVNLEIPVYNLRYALGILPGLALVMGIAVDYLPNHVVKLGAIVMLAVAGWHSFPQGYPQTITPHHQLLSTLAARYQPGDRIWYNMTTGARGSELQNEVAYHLAHDAPNLNTDWFVWAAPNEFVDPVTTPRVWDVRPYWIPLPEFAADEMTNGRTVTETYTFGAYTIRLYEAPPHIADPVHIAELSVVFSPPDDHVFHPGDDVFFKTWWAVDAPPDRDYSYGLYLFESGRPDPLIANRDAGLTLDGRPTSQWEPSDYHFQRLRFTLPSKLSPGKYDLWMGVYYWENPTLFPIEASDEWTVRTDPSMVLIGQITVK